jgi:radical SAM superfamily enzyme YgiQ (UPF0313 family)
LDGLRKNGFEGHINLFGFFPTLAYEPLLEKVTAVDSIAVGECEYTLFDLADKLKRKEKWQEIPGLAVRDNHGMIIHLPRMPEANPDRFSFPQRHETFKTAGILASRGCYNHCRFCPVPAFYNNGPLWRGRNPEVITEEIRTLKRQGISDFYFLDPNFIGPGKKGKERIYYLCKLLAPLDITFGMETRANDLSFELILELKKAGLQSLLIGIESGSSKVLGGLEKHGSVDTSEAAIAMCRKGGIEPEVGFLMFVPDSTVEDLCENLNFLKRNALLDRLDRTANLLSHRQIIFMGTSGYQRFKEQNRIISTGPLGFMAETTWADPLVKWIADVIIYTCLLVLDKTGDPASPLYWERHTDWLSCRSVNDYLVNLFERCLEMVKTNTSLPATSLMQIRIQTELEEIVEKL